VAKVQTPGASGQRVEDLLVGFRRRLAAESSRQGAAQAARPAQLTVSNELNKNVTLVAADGSRLLLAPLEERRQVEPDEDLRFALRCWPGVLELNEPKATRNVGFDATLAAVGFAFFFAFPWAIVAVFVGTPRWWQIGWGALASILLACLTADLLRRKAAKEEQKATTRLIRWLRSVGGQQFYLMLGILIGFVLPAGAIFYAADVWSLVGDLWRGTLSSPEEHLARLTLIGRLLQLIFVGIASLTPALLFFLFDREHLETLRARFIRQIMRFDPSVKTRQQALAKYGQVMDEAYGPDVQGKILPGRRSPLLPATLLIALGWTLTLLHGDLQLLDERGIGALFEPRLSGPSFAFLGAYFYGVNVVLRGYVRRDLRAKTYSALTVRILIVVILAWVLGLIWSSTTLYVLAFLTGIFPDTALVLIKETARRLLGGLGGWMRVSGDESDPLTKLEGIDLYELARLFDEGVTNVQGLAHDDVVDLMLQTRIPGSRILDWVDQAILFLHAGPAADGDASENAADQGTTAAPPSDRDVTLAQLRRFGIRTATDLFNAYDAAKANDRLDELLKILPTDPPEAIPRLQVMVDVLQDEEWVVNLRSWRSAENAQPGDETLKVAELDPVTFAATYDRVTPQPQQ